MVWWFTTFDQCSSRSCSFHTIRNRTWNSAWSLLWHLTNNLIQLLRYISWFAIFPNWITWTLHKNSTQWILTVIIIDLFLSRNLSETHVLLIWFLVSLRHYSFLAAVLHWHVDASISVKVNILKPQLSTIWRFAVFARFSWSASLFDLEVLCCGVFRSITRGVMSP